MKLEFPLNEALPNTDHARDRLLAKIFQFRRSNDPGSGATDKDFALVYAYGKKWSCNHQNEYLLTRRLVLALVTGQISNEIREVSKEIESLFGVLNEERLRLQ